jgi:hypothetical protein
MLALIFTFSIAARAGDMGEIPKKIERLNQQLRGMQGPKDCTNCGFNSGIEAPPDAWKQCLAQVCGNNLNKMNEELSRAAAAAKSDPTAAGFQKLIDDAFRSDLELEAAIIKYLRKGAKAGPIQDPNAVQIGNIMEGLGNTRRLVFDDKMVPDITATQEAFVAAGLSRNHANISLAIGKALRDDQAKTPLLFKEEIGILRQQLSPEQLQREISNVFKYMGEGGKRISDKLGINSGFLGTNQEELRKMQDKLSSGQFGPTDIDRLRRSYVNLHIYDVMLNNPDLLKHASSKEFILPPLNDVALGNVLNQVEDTLAGRENPASSEMKQMGLGATWACRVSAALAANLLPAEADVSRFVKHEEPKIRRRFLDKLKGYLSRSSAGEVDGQLTKAVLNPPQGRDEYLRDLRDGLKALAQTNRTFAAQINQSKFENPQVYLAMATTSRQNGSNPFSTIKNFCNANTPPIANDSAFIYDNKFHLSGDTAMNGPDSHFVCNHEYAHLVSQMLQTNGKISEETKNWHDRVQSCLRQGHDDGDGPGVVEEDLADLLGSSFTGGGSYVFCGLIPNEEKSLTLKNWDPEDKDHSGHLYRVLHARVLNGDGIPEVCRSALAEKGETPFERNCLKETPEAQAAMK